MPGWSGVPSLGQARDRGLDCLGLSRAGLFLEDFGSSFDAERLQKRALRNGSVHQGAGLPGAARQGRKVDMGGQVRFAGLGQRIDESMGLHGLQRFAEPGGRVAIIDDQRSPSLAHQAGRDRAGDAAGREAEFEDRCRAAPRG